MHLPLVSRIPVAYTTPKEADIMANTGTSIGVIGGADGPTAILVSGSFPWAAVGAILIIAAAVILGLRRARKKK